ncbi:epimerase, partial [Litorilinea aerophila]
VTSFSLSAGQIRERVLQAFPDAQITFAPDPKREAIIDSWPADLDDSAARVDWGWQPQYDVDRAFQEYLFPNIQARYRRSPQGGGN